MITKRTQIPAGERFLHLKVSLENSLTGNEKNLGRQQAVAFCWGLLKFLNKEPKQGREADQARVLRLSFEDDFEEDLQEEEEEEEIFIPIAGLLEEEEPSEGEEEEGPQREDDLFYK